MRYNTPNSPMDNVRDFVTRGGIPVTMTLLIVNVLTFFSAFFSPNVVAPLLEQFLLFSPSHLFLAPWTLVTYPLYEPGILR